MVNDNWQTPPWVYDIAERMGIALNSRITLDPCTSPDNPLEIDDYFTEKDDGLRQSWRGHLAFMNHPYSVGNSWKWFEKAYLESRDEHTSVIGCTPLRLSTRAAKTFIRFENTILLHEPEDVEYMVNGQIGVYPLEKRVRYIDPNTGKQHPGSPNFETMLPVWL